MNNILLFSIVILSTSFCFAQRVSKKEWINMYKEYATYRCMCETTNNKLERIFWDENDISFIVHEDLLGNYYDEADSVGRSFARKIQPIQVDKEHDLWGMKPLYKESLLFYNSKYLDSIARKSYKVFIRSSHSR